MNQETIRTAWMWTDDMEMRAVTVDLETHTLAWFDQIGCHCGDSTHTQSGADFLRDGAPSFVGPLPAAVAEELEAALKYLGVI